MITTSLGFHYACTETTTRLCRYYITRHSLSSLSEVGLICFRGANGTFAHSLAGSTSYTCCHLVQACNLVVCGYIYDRLPAVTRMSVRRWVMQDSVRTAIDSHLCFHMAPCASRAADQVYVEMKRKARDAVLAMIEREREGEQIDRALLKNVLDIFIAVGMGQMETYQHDFEESLLTETAVYYKRKVRGRPWA